MNFFILTLFLYTKGTEGNPSEELRQLLHYMEFTNVNNAINDSLRNIQEMVNIVRMDEGVSLEYMKIFEREEMLIEQGRDEERINTQKESERARKESERADKLQKELDQLKKILNMETDK